MDTTAWPPQEAVCLPSAAGLGISAVIQHQSKLSPCLSMHEQSAVVLAVPWPWPWMGRTSSCLFIPPVGMTFLLSDREVLTGFKPAGAMPCLCELAGCARWSPEDLPPAAAPAAAQSQNCSGPAAPLLFSRRVYKGKDPTERI